MHSLSIYAARESGLHSLNPLTKLVLTLCIMICGVTLPGTWDSYWVLALVIVPLSLWGTVTKLMLRLVMKISWPLVLSVFIIQTVFWGNGTALFEIGPLAPKMEGLLFAIRSSGRILLIMSDFILFSLATRPDTLMISIKQAGVPSSLAYIVVTTLQLVPQFVTKANTILDAQRSRGMETQGNLFIRARALLPLVLPLVVGSLLEVEERAIAIEARGFNSKRVETSLLEIPDTQNQQHARIGFVGITIILIAARYLWLL